MEKAEPYEEILLADGIYSLQQYAIVLDQPGTLRNESENSKSVVIERGLQSLHNY